MMGFKDAGLPLGDFINFTRWFDAVEELHICELKKALNFSF